MEGIVVVVEVEVVVEVVEVDVEVEVEVVVLVEVLVTRKVLLPITQVFVVAESTTFAVNVNVPITLASVGRVKDSAFVVAQFPTMNDLMTLLVWALVNRKL
jgi:hypothetical protein